MPIIPFLCFSAPALLVALLAASAYLEPETSSSNQSWIRAAHASFEKPAPEMERDDFLLLKMRPVRDSM